MRELTPALAAKLDEDLTRMLTQNVFDDRSAIPVTIRCSVEHIAVLSARVAQLGGKVRHQFQLVGAVAAWVPLGEVPELAADDHVHSIELEQQFSLA